jgi:hypothetical protein
MNTLCTFTTASGVEVKFHSVPGIGHQSLSAA